MKKTILITGATDGLGLMAAEQLVKQGHRLLLHGRSAEKLEAIVENFSTFNPDIYCYQADFSELTQVKKMADKIQRQRMEIDAIVNNAGVLKSHENLSDYDIDIRFRVNTIAPYILTKGLLNSLSGEARVINIASAAQAEFSLDLNYGKIYVDEMQAYSESKLALITWTFAMAQSAQKNTQFIAVNPGSLLATKMVKEGFGIAGKELSIGASLIVDACIGDKFANANGCYFDNDLEKFSQPQKMAMDSHIQNQLVQFMDSLIH